MHKCWNCGTEHETQDAHASFIRGQYATIERIKTRLIGEICASPGDDEPCSICGGLELALMIIDDEFRHA